MDIKDKYAWTYTNENEMFFWAKSTTNIYLTSNALIMPENLIQRNGKGKIKAVSKNIPPIFERFGIPFIGFSKKTKDFYQIIGKTNYFIIFIVEDGKLPINILNEKKILKRGDVLFAPPNAEYITIHLEHGFASIFWAHLNLTWCKSKKNSTKAEIIRNLDDTNLIFHLAHAYESEAYNSFAQISILENIAQSLVDVLKRNIENNESPSDKINQKINNAISRSLKKNLYNLKAPKLAKELKVSLAELNRNCQKMHSLTFAKTMLKLRMNNALKLLKTYGILKTSQKLNYANPFVFSRAFKKYFGVSPSTYTKK